MKLSSIFRFRPLVLLFTFVTLAVIILTPNVVNLSEESSFPFKRKINLGLDLQGGLYMILGIDFDKVYKDEVAVYTKRLLFFLKDEGIEGKVTELDVTESSDPKMWVEITAAGSVERAKEIFHEKNFSQSLRLTGEDGSRLQFALNPTAKTFIEENALTKSIEVIRNRIDEFGVTEPEIVSQGKDRIVVQLPGVRDIKRAKELIGKTAKLEFKLVNDTIAAGTLSSWMDKLKENNITYEKGQRFSDYIEKARDLLKEEFPKGYTLAFQKQTNAAGDYLGAIPFLVEQVSQVTGEDLQDANTTIDQQNNRPVVSFELKASGTKIFRELTTKNVGKRLAIILDGNVYTAPSLQSPIPDGRGQITLGSGNYDSLLKQSRDISLVLRAGALPVELEFEEQRIVGPSLGKDSITAAKWAGLIGAALVFLFIIFYYKMAGVIASVTLVFNVTFVLAFLVLMEATLTLPGIAGIALTIGMAVDANIIIFERIREEMRKHGKFALAVEAGFKRAFWTILDANITTGLAGICLISFGTGPVRGFAVTLLIGIFSTIYTAYFVGKLLFEFFLKRSRQESFSI